MLKNDTALLVVDMQYGGGAPDGSLVRMLNVDVSRQEDIVSPMIALKEFFRREGMLIVNIMTEYEADFRDWPMLAERFPVREYKHFVKGTPDAAIRSARPFADAMLLAWVALAGWWIAS